MNKNKILKPSMDKKPALNADLELNIEIRKLKSKVVSLENQIIMLKQREPSVITNTEIIEAPVFTGGPKFEKGIINNDEVYYISNLGTNAEVYKKIADGAPLIIK